MACKPPENIPADIALTKATPTNEVDAAAAAAIGIAACPSAVEDAGITPCCFGLNNNKDFCSTCRDVGSVRKERYDLVV